MKPIHVVASALVLAACAGSQKNMTEPQKAAMQAQEQAEKAQESAQKAHEDAESAQKDLAEAEQANNEARQAQLAADQRASQAADQAQHARQQAGMTTPAANAPKTTGVTESQGPGASPSQGAQPAQGQQQPAQKTVLIASGVLFATGSADISEGTKARLDKLASALSSQPQANNVIISGHTDDVGDPQQNLTLSNKRAMAVADYLESKGVPKERIVTRAVGEKNAVGTENTPEDRASNRRVDILVRPVPSGGQDQKGQDQKGQDQKGQDQKGQDQNAPQSP